MPRLLRSGISVYVVFGTVLGIALERIRYDRRRTEVLERGEHALHELSMNWEGDSCPHSAS